MDTAQTYRETVKKVLNKYAATRYRQGDIHNQAVYDHEGDHYLVVSTGWQNLRNSGVTRVYGCVVHVDLIGDKVWIQRDGTEEGIADELVEAGIPHEHIVLAYRRPELRQYTGFATA